jgi:hypothetical protein
MNGQDCENDTCDQRRQSAESAEVSRHREDQTRVQHVHEHGVQVVARRYPSPPGGTNLVEKRRKRPELVGLIPVDSLCPGRRKQRQDMEWWLARKQLNQPKNVAGKIAAEGGQVGHGADEAKQEIRCECGGESPGVGPGWPV